jgi:hypothetical protein
MREQFFLLLIDEETAVEAIAGLRPEDIGERGAAFERLLEILEASGQLTDAEAQRLERLKSLFGIDSAPVGVSLKAS